MSMLSGTALGAAILLFDPSERPKGLGLGLG
jgi:hypothetical protein